MNTKKINLHDHQYGSPLPDPQPFPGAIAGLSFETGRLVSSAPQQHDGTGGWLQEEYSPTPRPGLAMQGSCVGSGMALWFEAEHLPSMARFDCPLGTTTTLQAMAAAKTAAETGHLYRPVDPLLLGDNAVRRYYVQQQPRDAEKAPPLLKLPLQQQQQQQEGVHGLVGNASTSRSDGRELKTHPFSPDVLESTLHPPIEATSIPCPMENPLSGSCNIGAPPATSTCNAATAASKTRIRWRQDLHERFVDCVSQLGGANKATPKGILKLMTSDGLTIYQIKSHLQKYRVARHMPESSEGKLEKRVGGINLQNLDPDTGMQVTEALRIQLDVQRRLQEQLEIQENLLQRIEEQGQKLQKMFEVQLKASTTVMEPREELQGVGVGAAIPGVSEHEELQGGGVFFPGVSEQEVFDDVQLLSVASRG